LQSIGIILAVPLVVALFPSIFFRLKLTTAYEYLERRFSYPVRGPAERVRRRVIGIGEGLPQEAFAASECAPPIGTE
jgi:hypothetical protein